MNSGVDYVPNYNEDAPHLVPIGLASNANPNAELSTGKQQAIYTGPQLNRYIGTITSVFSDCKVRLGPSLTTTQPSHKPAA